MPSVTNVVARPRTNPGRANNEGENRFYLVEFDTAGFDLWQARNATGVPVDGEELFPGSSLVVTFKEAVPVQDSPTVALVEVRWTVPTLVVFPPSGGGKWAVTVESEGVEFVEPVTRTTDDHPVANSAGQQFDPSPDKLYHDEKFIIGYTTEGDPSEGGALRGKINSDAITMTIKGHTRTFPPRTLKMGNVSYGITLGQPDASGQILEYWRVTVPLLYRADTWIRKIVDAGYYELSSSNTWTPILDDNGTMIAQPAFLDGEGLVLEPGFSAVLLEFQLDEEAPFATFLNSIG